MKPDHKRPYVFANIALQLVGRAYLLLPKCGIDLQFPANQMFAK